MPFDGLRVVSFESRRATEMGELIRRQGGDPFVAPSMREAPIENNPEALKFAEQVVASGRVRSGDLSHRRRHAGAG